MEKIYLRPHHFLCTQTFIGKGYSKEFVEIELTFSCDSLCAFCPNRLNSEFKYFCNDDPKVLSYDQNVIQAFHLQEKAYVYADIIQEINSTMTPELLDHICSDCSWINICKINYPFK